MTSKLLNEFAVGAPAPCQLPASRSLAFEDTLGEPLIDTSVVGV